MTDAALPPVPIRFLGVRVAGVFCHPAHGSCVHVVHPVSHALHDVCLVYVTIGVAMLERVHHLASLGVLQVAVVGCVECAAPYHERCIAQILQAHVAGVSCHHGCRRPAVCHAWCHSPHAIAAGGVTHDVDAVGVHVGARLGHGNEGLVVLVEVGLAPHVPIIVWSAWRDVPGIVGNIEMLLVVPLLVVHLCRSATASVQ